MGQVISTIFVGFIVGVLARFVYPGPVPMGFVGSVLLGICGSLLGGYLPRLFDRDRQLRPFEPAGFIGSIIGAVLIIFLVRALS